MATCAYCNTTILFGGKRQDGMRFCNAKCAEGGRLLSIGSQLPSADVLHFVRQVHQGNCPRCSGEGPVDVYKSYRVWSALFLTSWSIRPTVCCRSCGTKKTLLDTLYSTALGWWGVPWGVVMTPVQIVRNIKALIQRPNPKVPTAELERMVRLHMASSIAQAHKNPN